MGRRKTSHSYTLIPVDLPPQKPKPRTGPRVSALQRKVMEASETRGQWFKVADYGTRTGAYGGKKRIDDREWPWPVVTYPVVNADGETSSLYIKVLEVPSE